MNTNEQTELNAATRRAEQAEKELSSANEALKLAAEALHKIKEMNGPGLDLSPANQEYKIAETALSHPAIQAILGKE